MRILLDANVLLDCLVLENSGLPRLGKASSDRILNLCDTGVHQGLVAWHTLPIIAYYFSRQNTSADTGMMMDALLSIVEVPSTTSQEAKSWRGAGIQDFEDALQVMCAIAGGAALIVTRNTRDLTVVRCEQ